jgi:Domain of unknown function (DUF4349)
MTSAELISELQAARPAASDALRERVRELAAPEPGPRRSPFAGFSLRRLSAVALPAAAALALAAAGAIGLSRSGEDGNVAVNYGEALTRESTQARAPAPNAAQDNALGKTRAGSTSAPAVGPVPGRPQRFSAQLTLEVANSDALSDATQQALQLTRALGGYAVSVSYGTADETGTASLVLRVPTAKVQDAIARLSSLGTIVGEQVQIDDLGDQLQSLEQREHSLREQIARLTARLASEELTDEQRAVLQTRRAAAQRELATVRQQQAGVRREASLATLSLALRTKEGAAVPAPQSRLDRTLDEALNVLAWEGIALLYAAIVAAPFALLGAAAVVGARHRRRREEERLLAAS